MVAHIGTILHAGVLLILVTKFGHGMLEAHDGHWYAALATDPALLGESQLDFTSYRALRIGMPLLAAPFTLVNPTFALALVQLASVWIGVRSTARLAVRRGLSPWFGLFFAAVPGTLIATRVLVADALAAAAMLAAVDAYESGRTIWVVWAVLAVLSREMMVLAVIALAFLGWKRAWIPLAVFAIWASSLLIRFGWEAAPRALDAPFAGLLSVIPVWWASQSWTEGATMIMVLAVSSWMALLAVKRGTPLEWVAGSICLSVPFLGSAVWMNAIHTQRLMILPLIALIVARNTPYEPAHGRRQLGRPTRARMMTFRGQTLG